MKKLLVAALGLNVIFLVVTGVLAFKVRSIGLERKAAANLILDQAEIKLTESRQLLCEAKTFSENIAPLIKELEKKTAELKAFGKYASVVYDKKTGKVREVIYANTPESRNEPKKADSRPVAEAVATDEFVEPEFAQIRRHERSMTEAQFAEYSKPFIGKFIRWSGWVEAVEKDGSAYTVKIDMDSPSTLFSVYEVYLENMDEYQALRIQKNQKLSFSGNIYSMSKDISLNIRVNPSTTN